MKIRDLLIFSCLVIFVGTLLYHWHISIKRDEQCKAAGFVESELSRYRVPYCAKSNGDLIPFERATKK